MSKRRWLVCAGMSLGMSISAVRGASAQATVPPSSLKGLLLGLAARAGMVTGLNRPELVDEVEGLAELTTLEVSTAPLGTSTGGFSFTFDSQSGTFTRVTRSFGPSFAERSLTAGKGKFSVGFNWLHANYNSIGGLDLLNGDLRTGQNAKNIPFDYSPLKLDLSSDTIVGLAGFGVTKDFDIGIAVPWTSVTLDADLGLFTASNVDVTPGGHVLVVPRSSASGVGDIAIFGKYHIWHQGEGGLAAEIELRLSSGNTNELRGTGVTRTLVSAIWSRGGTVSPHANLGYEFWSSAVPISSNSGVFAKNQINYALGLEIQAHPRATVSLDVIGRRQLHGGQIGYRTLALGPASIDVLVPLPEGLNVVSFAPGIKWNIAGNVLVTGNLLASLANQGLRANVIPAIGLDWAF